MQASLGILVLQGEDLTAGDPVDIVVESATLAVSITLDDRRACRMDAALDRVLTHADPPERRAVLASAWRLAIITVSTDQMTRCRNG